jgi:hypothetical protein
MNGRYRLWVPPVFFWYATAQGENEYCSWLKEKSPSISLYKRGKSTSLLCRLCPLRGAAPVIQKGW